jgi:cell division protein FtsA
MIKFGGATKVKKSITVTGLDIGSSKIAAVVARVGNDGIIDIVAHATDKAGGIDRGVLVDLNDSIDSVAKVLGKLKSKVPGGRGDIYANISAQDVKGAKSIGMIPISLRGREITAPDIEKSVNAASTIHLPFDREIIHKIVHSFSIDDQPWIRNPLGLYASRLACEAYVITANVNHIQSIYKCVNDTGYDVKEMAFTGMASGMSLLDKEMRESGAILVDMGDSLTEISVFTGGALDSFDVVGFGGRDARDDFRSSEPFKRVVSVISEALRGLSKRSPKASSVILTGGLALADGMIEFMEGELSHPIKMGALKGVRGDISGLDSVRLATAIGLCGYAYEKRLSTDRSAATRIRAKVVELFNSYF